MYNSIKKFKVILFNTKYNFLISNRVINLRIFKNLKHF